MEPRTQRRSNEIAYYYRHRELCLERHRAWQEKNREKVLAAARTWKQRNKHKTRAHATVARALKSGKLERGPCDVCGESIAEAHHEDYTAPLDVRWLCRQHHLEHHRKYPELAV